MDPFHDIGVGLVLLTFAASFAACFFSSLSGGGAGLILQPVLSFTGLRFINALASQRLIPPIDSMSAGLDLSGSQDEWREHDGRRKV